MKNYPVPWDLVFGLTPHMVHGSEESIDAFTTRIVGRMQPPPSMEGLDCLPDDPRFVLVANHYQRKGLWILHTASLLTHGVRVRYGPGDPPVRWVVTANWPPVRMGRWRLPNPGDWLLPRVAHALCGYPVAFAARDPGFTARSLRRILRDAASLQRPLGIFPEGVGGSADRLAEPLPGVGRFLSLLARQGLGAVPACVWESGDRLHARFGNLVSARDVLRAKDPAGKLMSRIADLLHQTR